MCISCCSDILFICDFLRTKHQEKRKCLHMICARKPLECVCLPALPACVGVGISIFPPFAIFHKIEGFVSGISIRNLQFNIFILISAIRRYPPALLFPRSSRSLGCLSVPALYQGWSGRECQALRSFGALLRCLSEGFCLWQRWRQYNLPCHFPEGQSCFVWTR